MPQASFGSLWQGYWEEPNVPQFLSPTNPERGLMNAVPDSDAVFCVKRNADAVTISDRTFESLSFNFMFS
jgi:hypothetical protein